MKTFKLIVSTPDGNLFDNEVLEMALRGTEGDFAVRADHIPFITATVGGKMRITDPEGEDHIATVSDGILTVTKEKTTFMCMEFAM